MRKTYLLLLRAADTTLLFVIICFLLYIGWCVYREPTVEATARNIHQYVFGIIFLLPDIKSLLLIAGAVVATAVTNWILGLAGVGSLASSWLRVISACTLFAGVILQNEHGNVAGGVRLFLIGALCFVAASTRAHHDGLAEEPHAEGSVEAR